MNKKILLLLLIVSLTLGYFIFKRSCISEKDRIKKEINTMVKAVKEKDLRKFMSSISKNYKGEYNTDYDMTKAWLLRTFLAYEELFVAIRDLNITVAQDNNQAEALFIATFLARQKNSNTEKDFTIDRGSNRFKLYLIKEDKDWKIIKAENPESTFD